MHHLLLAVFEHRSDARAAMDELIAAGFEQSDLRLSEGDPGSELHAEPEGGGIGAFFKAIFGADRNEAARMYADAVTRGHIVLTLCCDDPGALGRAADIVDDFGAIDIEKRYDEWRSDAVLRTSPGVQQQASPGASQSAGQGSASAQSPPEPSSPSRRGGARLYQMPEPHILQRRAIDHMVDPADLPALQPQSPEPGRDAFDQLSAHDTDLRHHWHTTYAGSGEDFDDYAPAYQYGIRMRHSEHFRDMSWDDAETDLRQEWQATKPASTWDKVKAAIRHGWDRMTD